MHLFWFLDWLYSQWDLHQCSVVLSIWVCSMRLTCVDHDAYSVSVTSLILHSVCRHFLRPCGFEQSKRKISNFLAIRVNTASYTDMANEPGPSHSHRREVDNLDFMDQVEDVHITVNDDHTTPVQGDTRTVKGMFYMFMQNLNV